VISEARTKDFSLNLASRYRWVMADSSFDVVSKVDRMELDNALNQASREVATRFDFKNTGVKIEMSGEKILVEAETEERVKAALDVLKEKMIKRNVSLKHLDIAEPMQSGKVYRIFCTIKEGISQENAKKITKLLKDEGPKSVRAQIQGDELRVSSKSRDDLQTAIALIKGAKLDFAVQFTNYR
jgi:uncharacterized protein YajQ (UPF0234 family)